MKTHIINYSKTRDVYVAYRKSGYSRKFFEEHRESITIHKAAKDAFDKLGLKKLPRVKELSAEYARVLAEKKAAYPEYRKAREQMQEYLVEQKVAAVVLDKETSCKSSRSNSAGMRRSKITDNAYLPRGSSEKLGCHGGVIFLPDTTCEAIFGGVIKRNKSVLFMTNAH